MSPLNLALVSDDNAGVLRNQGSLKLIKLKHLRIWKQIFDQVKRFFIYHTLPINLTLKRKRFKNSGTDTRWQQLQFVKILLMNFISIKIVTPTQLTFICSKSTTEIDAI